MSFTKVTSKATTTISAAWDLFNGLITDLLATTSGKGASQIGIYDAASNMAAANVEDALAEIYTDHASTKTLAEALDKNTATTTGLTFGWKAGTIRVDNTVTTVAASTIALTDDATNYVEVNSSGTVSRNTTGFTSTRMPIRQITAASGVQTVSTDKRTFWTLIPANVVIETTLTVPNTGLHILDTDSSHDLIIKPGSDLSADKTLTITTGDADRTLTLNENLTVGDGANVTITAEDTAGSIVLDKQTLEIEGEGTATRLTKIINNADSARTLTFTADLTVESTSVVNQDLTTDASPTFDVPTVAGISPILKGYVQRAKFKWKDADEILIEPGAYQLEGENKQQIVYWDAQLSTDIGSPDASDWYYLYIDDSAIASLGSNKIVDTTNPAELIWSNTEPTWTVAKHGWYNGYDRCIFAVYSDGSSNITEFFHEGELCLFDTGELDLSSGTPVNVWTDVVLTMPKCSQMGECTFLATWDTADPWMTSDLKVRVNGQTGGVGHSVVYLKVTDAEYESNTCAVMTDDSQTIEVRFGGTGDDHVVSVITKGWYLPHGM